MSNPAPRRSKRGKTIAWRTAEARRRRRVAALRNRGLTIDEITEGLAKSGEINPETQTQWGRSTVQKDLLLLLEQDREVARREHGEWYAEQIARGEELWRAAWAAGDLPAAQRAWEGKNKLLGTNAPEKQEHTGKDGGPLRADVAVAAALLDLSVMTPEDQAAWQRILEAQIAAAKPTSG